jgi:hypothetical protein
MQKFEYDPTVGSKVITILTRYSSLADQISSSPSNDLIATPGKMASGNSSRNLSAIQRSNQKVWSFWVVTQVWRPELITELQFHSNPNENGLRKLLHKFERDPLVKSKVMAVLTPSSSLADQTSSDLVVIPEQPQEKQPMETHA